MQASSIKTIFAAKVAAAVGVSMVVLSSLFFLEAQLAHVRALVGRLVPIKREDTSKLQVFDLNIKNDANPSKLEKGEQPWSTRRQGMLAIIQNRTSQYPTLIGLQEVIEHQLTDLLEGLGSDWSYCGVPRGGVLTDNEYNPVLYNKNEFQLLANKTFWLSETPDVPSKSWNADYNRIVTVTEFKHLGSGRNVNFWVTHLSANSSEARTNLASEIDSIASKLGNNDPIFLAGDFNSHDTDPAYHILTGPFSDAYNATVGSSKRDFSISYDPRIDYIFYQNRGDQGLRVSEYETLSGVYDGYFISDHAPIYAVFEF